MNKREWMVEEIKRKYGLRAPEVFEAMQQVLRHKFLDAKYFDDAYEDKPVPIGFGQTVSQPLTVAFMTNLLDLDKTKKVLEIGTGSGYQTAVLSLLGDKVYSVERISELANRASEKLVRMGFENVEIKHGDGQHGWAKYAPFNAILVTAGIKGEVPRALIEQLGNGGVLVAPVNRVMKRYKKKKNKVEVEDFGYFSFVPFVESMSS